MATRTDLEHRRRERMRRERRRKKQRRALFLLIALICLIILIIVSVSRCASKKSQQSADENTTVTLASTDGTASALPPSLSPSSSVSANIPPASEENNLMTIVENSSDTKRCYLTFDDGPTTNITPQVLDVLRRYNVKATFFQIGSLIKSNPSMARRVYEEGHLIANHSDGHNYEKLYVSTDTFMNEVNDCYESIKDITGETEPFKLVRFPGGGFRSSYDSYSPVKQQCKETLQDYGFYYCDWNALNGDAEGRSKDADELLDYFIDSADGQDNIVVLMHDAASKQATVDALPSIIEYLMNEGYTFHRLDDINYRASSSGNNDNNDDDDDSDNGSSSSNNDRIAGSTGSSSDDDDDDDSAGSGSSSPSPSPTSTPSPTADSSSSGGSSGPIIIQ